jgi:hypothetical protein
MLTVFLVKISSKEKSNYKFFYLGYQTKIIEVDLRKSKEINIALEPSLTLQEICYFKNR